MSSASENTSKPATFAVPAVGLEIPINIFIAVVLPAPLAPKKPKISPLATSKVIAFTAVKSPNFLVNESTCITFSASIILPNP